MPSPVLSRGEHCSHSPPSFCSFSFIFHSENDCLQEAGHVFAAVNLNNNYFLNFEGQQHFSHITPPKSPRINIGVTALGEVFPSDVQTFSKNLLKPERARNNVLFWFGVWGVFVGIV